MRLQVFTRTTTLALMYRYPIAVVCLDTPFILCYDADGKHVRKMPSRGKMCFYDHTVGDSMLWFTDTTGYNSSNAHTYDSGTIRL